MYYSNVFQGVTKKQLKNSLKNKIPIEIISYCMGVSKTWFSLIVKEIKKRGNLVYFKAEGVTSNDKHWDCRGYIKSKKNYGAMTVKLKE